MLKLDYSLFILVVIATAVFTVLLLRYCKKLHASFIVGAVLLLLTLPVGWILVEHAERGERQKWIALVQGLAPTYSLEIGRLGHSQLDATTSPDDPIYLSIIDAQKRWLAVNRTIADIYTFRPTKDPTLFQFIVDSETDYDGNGEYEGDRESRTPIGETWENDHVVAINKALSGHPIVFDDQPITDRWGTWVSAYSPIFNESRQVDAVVGVDFYASAWNASIAEARWAGIARVAELATLIIAAFSVISVLLTTLQERKKTAVELTVARQSAERSARLAFDASEAKSRFLANMSHEIRTPMNGVIGMTELLLRTPLNEEQRDYQKLVLSSAHALLDLLNDILDFSKIEAGKLDLERLPVMITDLLEETVGAMKVRAEKSGLSLWVSIDDDVQPYVITDPTRLRQVIVNLIANAIKFTPEGSIEVKVAVEEDTDKIQRLRFSVVDTGIGISPQQRESIFQAFNQADSSTTRNFGGTGLGLSISAMLVALMEGKIGVESEIGIGSTFHFTIPVTKTTAADFRRNAESEIAESGPQVAASPRRILLVEDVKVNQQVAINLLEKRGHHVTLASNGREAVEQFESDKFDIVLMDVQMPKMDGFEATKAIRKIEGEHASAERTEIVAMTAHAMTGDKERCLAAGMDGYLAKPFKPSELFAAVEGGTIAFNEQEQATGGRTDIDGRLYNYDEMLKNTGADEELAKQLIEMFAKESVKQLREIESAVQQRDAAKLQATAHTLKGSVAIFGAKSCAASALRVEQLGKSNQFDEADAEFEDLRQGIEALRHQLLNDIR
ncbi:Autoinducer 2 sensor kinase/phosphatase LuxQ [Planctomycetes bacterium CA13]|uniref:Sensory/regulatory protein RpfC n=1 Tax=Novipirellula herctigrandis TaxID=2527986 RepID=A0A5C5ZAJ5_9BACT|nr:Autoinducer 2 sensor kinase/phosphatase LuxQ [Planctomycetes bacterium CA13]